MRKTIDKGNLSELKVITSYIEAGFAVSIPFGGGAPYDFIVDTQARLLKIQVKTGRLRNGCILFPTMRFSGHRGKGRRYQPREIDLFVVYCPDNDQVYVMSLEQSLAQGRIRCLDTKNRQKEKIKWASDYDFKNHIEKLRKEVVELRGLEPLTS